MRFALLTATLGAAMAQTPDGNALFDKHCASCHRSGSETRAPLPNVLRTMSRDAIVKSLETGSMKAQGTALSRAEQLAIAASLSEQISSSAQPEAGACAQGPSPIPSLDGWSGWGVDPQNTRFVAAKRAGLDKSKVANLKLKWAFGFPNANTVASQPALAGGRLFIGSMDGTVYSLDAKTGCRHWAFRADAQVRTAISIGPAGGGKHALYFGDVKANAYAIDADSGALVWKAQVDTHPVARITAAPVLYGSRLYVPVSSIEEVSAQNPKYACCSFRGGVVALDIKDGRQVWKGYTIPDPPRPTNVNSSGTQMMGPSGAAIWAAPAIDAKGKLVYVVTGNNYSGPADTHSDAIIAFDLETGSMRWSQQMTPKDTWNMACVNPNRASCPESPGEDLDFGASPIIRRVGGRDLLIAGQKSGVVHALDLDKQGAIVWQTRVGRGGFLGGIQWGSAADERNLYVALSDWAAGKPEMGGGLFALKLEDGGKLWHTPAPKPGCAGTRGCSAAQMAAVTLIPGVVFSGSMDGHMRAYDTSDGMIIWDFDTLRDFETVNGVTAKGGSLGAAGAVVHGGMVFVNSGYGALAGMPGNVLLAFE